MIKTQGNNIHWNYFIALERDLEVISRYIEFDNSNFGTHSVELARLLLSASSEVDVICKLICSIVSPGTKAENIVEYRNIITNKITDFSQSQAFDALLT